MIKTYNIQNMKSGDNLSNFFVEYAILNNLASPNSTINPYNNKNKLNHSKFCYNKYLIRLD